MVKITSCCVSLVFLFSVKSVIGQGLPYQDLEVDGDLIVNGHSNSAGKITVNGENGKSNFVANSLSNYPNNGYLYVGDENGNNQAAMYVGPDGNGKFLTKGTNGKTNFLVTALANYPNNGYLFVGDENGNNQAAMFVGPDGNGKFWTKGTNGKTNFLVTALANYPNNGYLYVGDENGTTQAGIYVDSQGRGVIFGDTKNFVVAHPEKANTYIWYASLEGPEVAAYLRGTASLSQGKTTITLPDHFQQVVVATGMTVQVTPLSADSKGLAVTRKSLAGITVQELHNGKGNYDFDWEVKCIRKGHEDYRAVRSEGFPVAKEMGESAKEMGESAEEMGESAEE
jgi:hypothetical protein